MSDIVNTTTSDIAILMSQFPQTVNDAYAMYLRAQQIEKKAGQFKDQLSKYVQAGIQPDRRDPEGKAYGIKEGVKHLVSTRETVSWKGVVDELIKLDPGLVDTVNLILRTQTKITEAHYLSKSDDIEGVFDAKTEDIPKA